MNKILISIFILFSFLSCKSIKVDPFMGSAEAGDFSLVMANGEFATSGYLFYRMRAGAEVGGYFQIIPPPFKGEIKVRAIGCGDKELFLASDGTMKPIDINFKEVFVFTAWPDKETCEVYVSAKFSVVVERETKVQIANGLVKVISFNSSYEPLVLNSPYSAFNTKYKKQEIQYSTNLRSVVESQKPPVRE